MKNFTLLLVLALFSFSAQAQNPVIAKQDFDNPIGLLSSSASPALNSFSSAADAFGVYQRGSGIVSFALLDDSACGFDTDAQGMIKCGKTDSWFGVADTDNGDNSTGDVTASWTFDIAGSGSLSVEIDMTAMGDFESSDEFNFTYSIDGGTPQPLFSGMTQTGVIQSYQLEDGDIFNVADPYVMEGVTLDNDFEKFTASVPGTGSQLTITFEGNTDGGSEAFAFDNICIRGQASGGNNGMLSAGDLAFVSYNFDNPDTWSLLSFTTIPVGTQIKFTDNGWLASGGFRANEGTITIEFTQEVACGVEFIVEPGNGAFDLNGGKVADQIDASGSLALSGSGDQILAYQGEDSNPSFITALHSNGSGWESDATSSNTSAVPTGLVDGETAVAIPEVDNAQYNCSLVSGDASSLRMSINNGANWDGNNSASQVPSDCSWDVSSCGGSTDPVCNITSVSLLNNSGCQDNGTGDPDDDFYTVDVMVSYSNAPTGGNLNLSFNGMPVDAEDVSNIGSSSFLFEGIALPADGTQGVLEANFSVLEGACSETTITSAVSVCSAPACNPVINEVDYDQPGADDAEFVELYNPCSEPIDLGNYTLIFVNGSNGTTYNSSPVALPSVTLNPGDYFVVCTSSNTVTPTCDFQPSSVSSIQNGEPDAIALNFGGTQVDALSYGGSVPGFTEGTGAMDEPSNAAGIGLSRFPDGSDTNNNAADFGLFCATPGAPNTNSDQFCSIPDPFEVDQLACNGDIDASYDSNIDQYNISTTCAKNGFTQDRGTFVTAPACGDVILDAKLESLFPSNGYAGITIRESMDPGAKAFSIVQYPGGRKNVEYRNTTNGAHQTYWFATWTTNFQYIRIVREGNLFKAYASFFGTPGSYQLFFAQFIPMSSCARAGILVTAPTEGVFTTANFSGVSISSPFAAMEYDNTEDENAQATAELFHNGGQQLGTFNVFPNPAVNTLNIRFEQTNAEEAVIRILSMDGRNVYEGEHGIRSGSVELSLGSLDMPNGMYLLQIATGDEVRTERFMKAAR